MDYITKCLFENQDEKYRDFHAALMPNIDKSKIIGVRVPLLRKLAKKLFKENELSCREFMNTLPHTYYEENNLHAFLIEEIKDFSPCIKEVEKFLPYVDNWATCDMFSPKALKKDKTALLTYVKKWISSEEEYTVRYGVGMLMRYYSDGDFDKEYPKIVSEIKSEHYYVQMMTAWYFATELAKNFDDVICYLEENRLDAKIHNKAIQKALESRRISGEKKEYLRRLKRKV